MAFSTAIVNKLSSEKYFLIRVEPARYVSGDLSLDSGTTYNTTFDFPYVFDVQVDGVAYSLVTTAPSPNEFSFNESTKEIVINLGAALTTQNIVAFYYLFYTTNQSGFRLVSENPTDSNTPVRSWQPRVARDPEIKHDQSDIIDGFLTFRASSIDLDNQDHDFEKHIGDNDSFSKKKVTFWQCIEDEKQLVFRGFCNSIDVGERVVIEVQDQFSLLRKTLFSNGTYLNSTYNLTRFPSMSAANAGAPIHRLFSKVSRYKITANPLASGLYNMQSDGLLKAINTNYNKDFTTANNREWGCNISEGDAGLQTDAVSSINDTDPNFTQATHGASKYYRIGDALKIGTQYVKVLAIVNSTNIKVTKNGIIAGGNTITRAPISIVIKQQDVDYFPLYDRDYTLATSGQTNDIIKITFTNNFEATLGMSALDPDSDYIGFRAWANTTNLFKHGDVIKTLLEQAGFSVNAASITAANLTSLTTNFYVPYVDSSNFQSYYSVLQTLISGNFGYLSVNDQLEIEYSLFAAPATTDETTDRHIMLNSFSTDIDYNDIIDSVSEKNDHDWIDLDYSKTVLENKKARYLHGTSGFKEIDHLLESPDRLQAILNVLSNRRALFSFRTKTNNINNIIGDDVKLVKDNLIGIGLFKQSKIVSITRRSSESSITTTDLLGL